MDQILSYLYNAYKSSVLFVYNSKIVTWLALAVAIFGAASGVVSAHWVAVGYIGLLKLGDWLDDGQLNDSFGKKK